MAAQDEVDVCESWEDMDEIGLDQKIKLMSSASAPVKTTLKGCKVTNVIVEESACIGSQCVMPEPAIRILKRPSSLANGQLNGERSARPVKTLEQRQKEYQEARLRILGEARSPEDVIDDNLGRLQEKLQANSISDSQNGNRVKSCQNQNDNAKGKERKVLTRLPAGATAAGVFPAPPPPGVLVLRAPRGPDGTRGFTHRFPRPDDEKREAWIKFVQKNRSEETWLPSAHTRICSVHFKEDQKYTTKTGRIFLKKSAVPCDNPEKVDKQEVSEPLSDPVSDSESIFDTPREIVLKKQLRKVLAAKKKLVEKFKKIQRQNIYLKQKCASYKVIMKKLRDKLSSSSQ